METISGIYCITNKINNKKYVGLSKDIYRRWGEHKKIPFNPSSKEYNYPLYNAIRKYGLDNFDFTILEQCDDQELLKEKEKQWIEYYDSINNGYNLTEGGECSTQKGENHPNAKLTEADVIFCRQEYAKGSRSKDIYDKYYSNRITYGGFQNMWHGKTWKHVMPEVFEKRQNTRQKITKEDILDIRTKYYQGIPIKEINILYENKYSQSTILHAINAKDFYPELWPNIEDNHIKLNQKITEEDVRLIKKLKREGYLHKDIRKALNNKVSMTTISDIVNNKRYSNIN